METQKLPFEITPEIKRYLEDILYLNDEWSVDAEHAFYLIKEEIKGEQSTPRRWENNKRFWDYLEKQKVVLAYHNLHVDDIKEVVGETPRLNVVATARTHEEHEDGKSPIERFFTRPDHWQKDLEKISIYATEHHEGENIVKPYLALRVFKIDFIRELLRKISYRSADIAKESGGVKQDQKNKTGTQQIELPEDTKWQDITIRFMDNGDHVEISTKKITRNATYQEMGFEDTRKRRPNAQWQFLRLLALPQFGGELSWEKLNAFGVTDPKERTSYKKKKQLLAKTLKNYFQMREDPFRSYRKEGSYKIKINLISSPDQQEIRQYEDEDDISSETMDYLKENAPSIYEKEKEYNDDY